MLKIELLYLIASTVAIVAMAPQVRQLFVTRDSRELHLPSWCIWSMNQLVAILYGISLQATPYIVINSIWFVYYLIMVALIIKYRKAKNAPFEGSNLEAIEIKV